MAIIFQIQKVKSKNSKSAAPDILCRIKQFNICPKAK